MIRTAMKLASAVTAAIAVVTVGACRPCCHAHTASASGAPANEITQEFPAGSMQTAWRVRWAYGDHRALYITGAWFRRAPSEAWITVLYDARLSDIFVPYHAGTPRYLDLSSFNFHLVPTSAADAGCCGQLLGDPPVAVREVRDRGVLWKDDATLRRGRELVIWGTLDAANYNYIIEYSFRDDGSIGFRLGATARNLPGIETMAHMHGGLWRIDMDLAGFPGDSASLVRHVESGSSASDNVVAFNGGVEGSADWNDLEFTQARITDRTRVNSRGHKTSYDLVPMRLGTQRHAESWTQHDFWVTRYASTELDFTDVATYASPAATVTNADLVLWYYAPTHHLPRDEDGQTVSGLWKGSALVMWSAFELRPRNLFDTTPLYP